MDFSCQKRIVFLTEFGSRSFSPFFSLFFLFSLFFSLFFLSHFSLFSLSFLSLWSEEKVDNQLTNQKVLQILLLLRRQLDGFSIRVDTQRNKRRVFTATEKIRFQLSKESVVNKSKKKREREKNVFFLSDLLVFHARN